MGRCGTLAHGLVMDLAVLDLQLDLIDLEVLLA